MLGECPDTHIACTFTPQCQLDSEHQQRIHCHELPNSDVERRLSNMMNLVFHIAPAGGIRWSCRSRFGIVYFNSRPRVGGVRRGPSRRRRPSPYFNSRPRVGGVYYIVCVGAGGDISILAPAWGASPGRRRRWAAWPISILAPAWGASHLHQQGLARRPISILAPAWGASYRVCPDCGAHLISILAPAWGASDRGAAAHAGRDISILAPAWGASHVLRIKAQPEIFQFSPPRGGRHMAGT